MLFGSESGQHLLYSGRIFFTSTYVLPLAHNSRANQHVRKQLHQSPIVTLFERRTLRIALQNILLAAVATRSLSLEYSIRWAIYDSDHESRTLWVSFFHFLFSPVLILFLSRVPLPLVSTFLFSHVLSAHVIY